MILYNPTDSEVHQSELSFNPQKCFIMRQLGGTLEHPLPEIVTKIDNVLSQFGLSAITANDRITGRDFLVKIWTIINSVQIGIAVFTGKTPPKTISNINYELGMMDALGKNTIVVKTDDYDIPSDMVRTEYILYESDFEEKLTSYLDNIVNEVSYFYTQRATTLSASPLLSLDYLRRNYLITGDKNVLKDAKKIYETNLTKLDRHNQIMLYGLFNKSKRKK